MPLSSFFALSAGTKSNERMTWVFPSLTRRGGPGGIHVADARPSMGMMQP